MSDYLEQALINHIFRGTAYTGPANVYIALYTAAPSDSGGGTEVSGSAYARVQVVSNTSNWSAPSTPGLTSNSSPIQFPEATGSWGTITHVGIFDAATSGNLLFHGALTASVAITTGQRFVFNTSQLGVTFA